MRTLNANPAVAREAIVAARPKDKASDAPNAAPTVAALLVQQVTRTWTTNASRLRRMVLPAHHHQSVFQGVAKAATVAVLKAIALAALHATQRATAKRA